MRYFASNMTVIPVMPLITQNKLLAASQHSETAFERFLLMKCSVVMWTSPQHKKDQVWSNCCYIYTAYSVCNWIQCFTVWTLLASELTLILLIARQVWPGDQTNHVPQFVWTTCFTAGFCGMIKGFCVQTICQKLLNFWANYSVSISSKMYDSTL